MKTIDRILERIQDLSKKCIDQYGYFNLGVTGGRSTKEIYSNLERLSADFSKWRVILLDERWVDENHPDSNSNQIRHTFFKLPGFVKESFISFHYGGPHPKMKEAEKKLQFLEKCHLSLIGVGEDGHICGLFPQNFDKDSGVESLCIVTENSPKPPSHRISVSYSFLFKSDQNFIILFGDKKRHLIEKKGNYPFSLLRNNSRNTLYTDF